MLENYLDSINLYQLKKLLLQTVQLYENGIQMELYLDTTQINLTIKQESLVIMISIL